MFSSNYDICSISEPNLVMYDKLTLIQNYVYFEYFKNLIACQVQQQKLLIQMTFLTISVNFQSE